VAADSNAPPIASTRYANAWSSQITARHLPEKRQRADERVRGRPKAYRAAPANPTRSPLPARARSPSWRHAPSRTAGRHDRSYLTFVCELRRLAPRPPLPPGPASGPRA